MKETTLSAMPPCFEKWCAKFDDLWQNQGQKKGFRYYLGASRDMCKIVQDRPQFLVRHSFQN
jgi:hypothetical protein